MRSASEKRAGVTGGRTSAGTGRRGGAEAGEDVPMHDGERLTPAQERLLGFIASRCVVDGSVALTKRELADRMGCCVRTVDRAVTRLRAEGYVKVREIYGDNGAQVANEYHLVTRA